MSGHALLSPSSAHRWTRCAGSVPLTKDLPNESSEFADEGTAAHLLAAACLTEGTDAASQIGTAIVVNSKPFIVDEEMAGQVQKYINLVRDIGGEALIEQALPIGFITGEDNAYGTADAIVFAGSELIVCDLKYGRGVRVDAVHNEQLAMYGMAALNRYDLMGDFIQVRMVICQPRLDHVSEWVQTVDELGALTQELSFKAGVVRNALTYAEEHNGEVSPTLLNPGDKQCQWCLAKATCPALAQHNLKTIIEDFNDLTLDEPIKPKIDLNAVKRLDNAQLSNLMSAADLIENWIKAVRAAVEAELLAGHDVPNFKLVQGRKGPRQWDDDEVVETTMKSMRLKDDVMYMRKIISPTAAESLYKAGEIGPRQWPKLQDLIVQNEGKPSVAPMSDKRPALVLTAVENDFEDESIADLL